jgi:hypothetical protein
MARAALRLRQIKLGVGILVTALAHLHVHNLERNSLEAGRTLEKKGGGGTLPQQEKNNSADAQRKRMSFTGFNCTLARQSLW